METMAMRIKGTKLEIPNQLKLKLDKLKEDKAAHESDLKAASAALDVVTKINPDGLVFDVLIKMYTALEEECERLAKAIDEVEDGILSEYSMESGVA